MPEAPKILTCEEGVDSRLFKVNRLDLEFSNGVRRTYEYLRAGEHAAVIIVPIIDNQVLMVEEYGAGVGRYEICLPKGKVDPGETAIEAANRELKEEAGYGARRLDELQCLSQSPNYMQHRTQIVLARDLYPERLVGDEPEEMPVHAFPLDDVAAIVAHELVTEARTIAALYLARDWIQQHG